MPLRLAGDGEQGGRLARYASEYRTARAEALSATAALHALLVSGGPLETMAHVSERAKLAAARLHTAALCILSPP